MAKPIKTISNPAAWLLDVFTGSLRFFNQAVHGIRGDRTSQPEVASLDFGDLRYALRKGWEDFGALRTDVVFIVIMYPVIGLVLTAVAFQRNLLPLLFPLMSGFALLGPIAAIGLYEMSRRRERDEPAGYVAAIGVMGSPAIGAILTIGLGLLLVFVIWILTAYAVFTLTLGPQAPSSAMAFLSEIFTTGAGWTMLIVGCGIGFAFAAVTLAATIVSIPLILDRHVGVAVAVATSLEVTRRNPLVVATWGLIVAASLVAATIPVFVGLILVFPVLGHATWHLYRRAVKPSSPSQSDGPQREA